MAPVKPMGTRTDRNPKTRPGVTGFEQDYNEEPPPSQELNPDAVTEDSVLPEPSRPKASAAKTTAKTAKKSARKTKR
jgi:hypothetical protein